MTKSAAITPTTTAVVVRDGGDNEITTPTPSVPKNHRQHSASEPPSTQTPPQQHHRQHRADLQCLRALAIAAVMALHLAPRHFPNGYAGVDVFFVLSGYLMAKMLDDDEKREQKRPTTNNVGAAAVKEFWRTKVVVFYWRRVRRLVPVYVLDLIGVVAIGRWLLPLQPEAQTVLRRDAGFAAAFVTNFDVIVRGDAYFSARSNTRFLLHMWSLAVELQYYAVAPFLIEALLAIRRNCGGGGQRQLITLFAAIGAVMLASGALQALHPGAAFVYMFPVCRVWQFFAGTLAHFASGVETMSPLPTCRNPPREGTPPTTVARMRILADVILYVFLVLSLTTLCFMPRAHLPAMAHRCAVTLFSAALVYFGGGGRLFRHDGDDGKPQRVGRRHWLLSWTTTTTPTALLIGALSYLGDISYSLYLVHWPMLLFTRYCANNVLELNAGMAVGVFVASIVLAAVQFELFEERVRTASWLRSKRFFALFLLLGYAVLVGVILVPSTKTQPPTISTNLNRTGEI